MDQWNFLEDFIVLQKKIKSHEKKDEIKIEQKIKPDFTYIKDLVAGRPVLTHPLRIGGFRLRYGRSRTSGLCSMSMHQATLVL
jgi:DNA polymerase II large subunit